MTESAKIDIAAADTAYRPFPSLSDWKGDLERVDLWEDALLALEDLRKTSSQSELDDAFRFVMRAAAIDTGAIEGLYEVDRGFTYSVAAQSGAWEAAMDERGEQIRPLFDAQLSTYELVLDAATKGTPIVEAWIRRLHEEVCAAQVTYRVLTQHGWEDRPLRKGRYKDDPNHVVQPDGSAHSYAPVATTAPEMARLVTELQSEAFQSAHPVVQAAYAHFALVSIHPFADGNGRVARALASVFLYRGVSIPLLVFADRKARYLDALRAADAGEHQSFTSFIARAALTATNVVIENLRAAAAPSAEGTVAQLRNLFQAQGDLTHKDMDNLARRVLEELNGIVRTRLSGLSPTFPPGLGADVVIIQGKRPEADGFRPPQGGPQSVRLRVTSQPPANAQVQDAFYVFVSTGRDPNESVLIIRQRRREDHRFSLEEVYPDLSTAGEARITALVERVWNELLAELHPLAEQSLRSKGY